MRHLVVQGGSYLTGDEIAAAVLRYGVALARAHQIGLVRIPFVDAAGAVGDVKLPIGWGIHPVSVSTDSPTATPDRDLDDLAETGIAMAIYEQASRVGVIRALPFTDDEAAAISASLPDGEGDPPL